MLVVDVAEVVGVDVAGVVVVDVTAAANCPNVAGEVYLIFPTLEQNPSQRVCAAVTAIAAVAAAASVASALEMAVG